jgi:hypothetical protein
LLDWRSTIELNFEHVRRQPRLHTDRYRHPAIFRECKVVAGDSFRDPSATSPLRL